MAQKKEQFPTQPSLVGKDVYLRPPTSDDIVNAHHWFVLSEPQAQACMPVPLRSAKQAVETFQGNTDDGRQILTIVRKEDKTPVGQIAFYSYNPLNQSAALGVIVDPDQRRNGFATDAMRVLVKYLFKHRNLNKVYAETPKFNTAAVALLESIGFKKDGALRNHHYYDGEYYDQLVYSFLRFELDW